MNTMNTTQKDRSLHEQLIDLVFFGINPTAEPTPMINHKKVCLDAARICFPEYSEDKIKEVAGLIYNASPTGELFWIEDLFWLIKDGAHDQVKRYVASLRTVEHLFNRVVKDFNEYTR